jgi:hypothetical protein
MRVQFVTTEPLSHARFVGSIKKGPTLPIRPSGSLAGALLPNRQRFWLQFLPLGVIDVMTATRSRRDTMSSNSIDTEKTPDANASQPKGRRTAAKKAKAAKKARQPKKAPGKPKADRSNKKADVIALMKRPKGATLPEIMKATGWQPHTVRGFDSILGSKGGENTGWHPPAKWAVLGHPNSFLEAW